MTEQRKPDLSTIEPLGRVPDAVGEDVVEQDAARVGRATAAVSNAPLAVGVEADADTRERETEPRTSPETEEELDRLRRG